MPSIIDYSQPISEILKESTKDAHDALIEKEGAKALVGGTLSKEDYILFLMMLYQVYDNLEIGLERHSTHPALEPTYNPTMLSRTAALDEDISFLTETTAWRNTELFQSLRDAPPGPLKAYTGRIQQLAESDPERLLAHAYVRYLGDMSGGQNMRRVMAKSYSLSEQDGYGLKFYDFKELQTSKTAGLGELRRIKDWYRGGMNAGTDNNLDRKIAVVDEVNKAFDFNGGLFDFLATDPDDDPSLDDDNFELVVEGGSPKKSFGAGFAMTSFVAVLLALCIGHFTLVVGGFTGTRGGEKLASLDAWLKAVVPRAGEWVRGNVSSS